MRSAVEMVQKVAAWIVVLGGLAHTAGTAAFFAVPSDEAAWFLGSGLAEVNLGLLNLVALRTRRRGFVRWAVHVANAANVGFTAFVLSQLPNSPQAYAGVFLAVLLLLSGLVNMARSNNPS